MDAWKEDPRKLAVGVDSNVDPAVVLADTEGSFHAAGLGSDRSYAIAKKRRISRIRSIEDLRRNVIEFNLIKGETTSSSSHAHKATSSTPEAHEFIYY